MCKLLKLHYAKFGVSNLLVSKVIEEKPLGVRSTPLGKGRVQVVVRAEILPKDFLQTSGNYQLWLTIAKI